MKKLFASTCMLVAVAPALSAELGVGVELARSSQTVYLPINVTSDFRLEPYISIDRSSRTGSTAGAESISIYGIGAFAAKPVTENTNLFFGARLAYQTTKQETTGVFSYRRSGYLISPTVGFEYLVTKSVAVGAEAGATYSRLTQRETGTGAPGDGKTKVRTFGTSSAVTLKYYFN